MLSDLGKALDFKCQVIDKVSALLKELTFGTYESNYPALASNVTFKMTRTRCLYFLISVEMSSIRTNIIYEH